MQIHDDPFKLLAGSRVRNYTFFNQTNLTFDTKTYQQVTKHTQFAFTVDNQVFLLIWRAVRKKTSV